MWSARMGRAWCRTPVSVCSGRCRVHRPGRRRFRGADRHLQGDTGARSGRVFAGLAVAVADGADAISGIAVLTDRQDLFGPVASTWRVLDRGRRRPSCCGPRPGRRPGRRRGRRRGPQGPARTCRRSCVWTSTPPSPSRIARRNAAATWKRTFGFHPVRREALTIRAEVRDHRHRPCRSRAVKLRTA